MRIIKALGLIAGIFLAIISILYLIFLHLIERIPIFGKESVNVMDKIVDMYLEPKEE